MHYVHKIGIALFSPRNAPHSTSMPLFSYIREDFNFILSICYQYTSIYIFRHSAILPDNFLGNKVLFKQQANHSVSLDKF